MISLNFFFFFACSFVFKYRKLAVAWDIKTYCQKDSGIFNQTVLPHEFSMRDHGQK